MLDGFYEKLGTSSASVVVIVIALMLMAGFLMTRITKRLHLPNVTAYIVAGVLIGPLALDLVPDAVASGMNFITDIALAFIAFSIGEFFRFSTLKKQGIGVLLIVLCEALLTTVGIFVLMRWILGLPLEIAVVLAALAAVTSPTAIMMVIRQKKAHGPFVETLLSVVALDDMIAILLYSVAISLALSFVDAGTVTNAWTVLKPLLMNLGGIALGGVFGLLLRLMMPKKRSTDNRLIIAIALLFAFCGITLALDITPLLGCMAMGTVYINASQDDRLFKQLNYFSPPLLLLFYVLSGTKLRLDLLFSSSAVNLGVPLIVVVLLYCLVRYGLKYGGTYLGCLATKQPRATRNDLGLALMPQGGVAIGLAALAARTITGDVGTALETIILSVTVIYELAGPALASLALSLSGACATTLEDLVVIPDAAKKTNVELLAERIATIRKGLPPVELPEILRDDDEDAFNEGADEYHGLADRQRRFPH